MSQPALLSWLLFAARGWGGGRGGGRAFLSGVWVVGGGGGVGFGGGGRVSGGRRGGRRADTPADPPEESFSQRSDHEPGLELGGEER